ncbi:membrane associated rhomboid family serine protease [Balneicella halophila]|uniref:Membrane associated rhomboid family serine protease n=1 Tax=Balneicella halophila TaxID=1537566 RepID=A0A7L4UME3_BALHA|nr:rhomboid family intramembrane serine protease [Balneicella halophila]PVX49396.1 membrane associated rhomboid family serine protease [Balneicella halophila]
MIFPIGDDNIKGKVKPIFTYVFIAVNIFIYFMFQSGLSMEQEGVFFDGYAANPCEITQWNSLHTLITSMFLHGSVTHLLGNMLYLWIFGDNIETTIGNFRYILFYLAGGVVAALSHVLIDGNAECIPMVGASGAISALIGAYLVMFPRSRIKMLFILSPRPFFIPAFLFIGFWIYQQFSGILGAPDSVAYWAHLGGLGFGVIMGFYFKTRYPKIEPVVQGHQKILYKTVKKNPQRFNNRFFNT